MKKTMMTAALILVCAGFVFAQTGVIRNLSGTVELKPAGTSIFVPAKAGDTLTRDTIVSTGFRSTALIAAGSTVITVRPLTRLSLAELSSTAGTETLNVNLQSGRIRVAVNPPAGTRANMSVRGPSATASVRGTEFDFDTRNLAVSRGVVAFQGSKGSVMLVSAGSTSVVESGGKAADPIETTAVVLVPPPPAAMSPPAAMPPPASSPAGGGSHTVVPDTAELGISVVYE